MNRTDNKLAIDIGNDETPNLALTQMQTPINACRQRPNWAPWRHSSCTGLNT